MKSDEILRNVRQRIEASGTSEGVRKSWLHRHQALSHLRDLRKGGFMDRVSVEQDARSKEWFLQKREGKLAEKKPRVALTPYDSHIRKMQKMGTQDMHGALADVIYGDKSARADYEADFPDGSWEDASGDLAGEYLSMHGIRRKGW